MLKNIVDFFHGIWMDMHAAITINKISVYKINFEYDRRITMSRLRFELSTNIVFENSAYNARIELFICFLIYLKREMYFQTFDFLFKVCTTSIVSLLTSECINTKLSNVIEQTWWPNTLGRRALLFRGLRYVQIYLNN